jgi:hypothetical protein
MMTEERYLPVGIQDFHILRERNAVYVDKTDLIYKLIKRNKYVFLSRPRRFGKSLLGSTMECYFKGQKSLFEGLAIASLEQDWVAHPVIHLSLASLKNCDAAQAVVKLREVLDPFERIYGESASDMPSSQLVHLVKRAVEQTGQRAVLIIDEYDAPLLSSLHKEDEIERVRETLQDFFSPVKDLDRYLEFVFITGITKFSQVSIFSALNNLANISMEPAFSSICGITERELRLNFQPEVHLLAEKLLCTDEAALAQLKLMYDGYHFSKDSEDIYNPFSLLRALQSGELEPYWFETGTPTFLLNQMKRFRTDISELDRLDFESDDFNWPISEMQNSWPLLFQTGYITIKSFDPKYKTYHLGIPNNEVKVGLVKFLSVI